MKLIIKLKLHKNLLVSILVIIIHRHIASCRVKYILNENFCNFLLFMNVFALFIFILV